MEQFIIARIEGEYAVLTAPDGASRSFPLSQLPAGVREGLTLWRGPDGAFTPDTADTDARHARIRRKMDALFEE